MRSRRPRLVVAAMAVALAVAPHAPAVESRAGAVEGATFRSISGRFLVGADSSLDATAFARWADQVAGRVDRLFDDEGIRQPRGLCYVVLVSAEQAEPLAIERRRRVVDRRLEQRLTIDERIDTEAILTAVVGALVDDRLYRAARDRAAPLVAPAWLVEGVAQNLFPLLRARNRAAMERFVKAGDAPRLAEVLAWPAVASGAVRERAACGLMIDWWTEGAVGDGILARSLERLAAGDSVTPDWLASLPDGGGDVAALEAAWRAWLERPQSLTWHLGGVNRELVAALAAELQTPPPQEAVATMPGPFSLGALIAVRREPWMAEYCRGRTTALRNLAAGKAEEYVQVVNAYSRIFAALPGRRPSARKLRRWLREAEAERIALTEIVLARGEFLDAIERRLAAGEAAQ